MNARRRLRRVLVLCGVLILAAVPLLAVAAWPRMPAPEPGDRRELVVLVHGMGRTKLSMRPLARALEREGYRVLNWGYSSTADSIPALADALSRAVARGTGAAPRVHFVGHSLGNILVRRALAERPLPRAGRVVMLAPPNQGAASAGEAAPYLAWLLPPLRELDPERGTVRAIPTPRAVEIGVVAGEKDGKVSVEETHLAGERDHVVVPAAHSFIMGRRDVQALVVRFLRDGSFGPSPRRPHPPS
ncbi:MAG TPA: alpha/beta fold hydrolase [Longimicrobiaceae bacterium]|nr:alpha/beta fold hydrolase [Longimicrobiaceae bacterium]